MFSRHIFALMAATSFVPATLALTSPAQAQQRGYYTSYFDRGGYEYGQYRRGTNWNQPNYGGTGRSSGVATGSEACNDPAYKMDPRCY
jgi:hypothetical protein